MSHWRGLARRIAFWTLPPGIQAIIRPHLNINLYSSLESEFTLEERSLLQKNRELAKHHAGERCFILGCGPSIKQQNLKLLKNETCIAVSNFFVHPDYATIEPQYYCIAPYHAPITEAAWQKWMKELNEATGDVKMFFSLTDRHRKPRNGFFAGKQIYYLKFGASWDELAARGVDITHPVPAPQSVTIMALHIAIYMGFQQIYLLGCDHDWIFHLNVSKHFYDENQHALNRDGYNEWFGEDLESNFLDYIKLWQQYKAIRRIGTRQAVRIYNATAGGLLDLFPRVSYETVFAKDVYYT